MTILYVMVTIVDLIMKHNANVHVILLYPVVSPYVNTLICTQLVNSLYYIIVYYYNSTVVLTLLMCSDNSTSTVKSPES